MLTHLVKTIRRETFHPLKHMLKSVLKNHVYEAKHGLAKGFKVTGDLGFLARPVEEVEDRFYAGLDLHGKTVYDVGSHIGLLALFFSRAVGPTGHVIAFEPNPETFTTLSKNIALNQRSNVRLLNVGLGEKRDRLELIYGEYDGGLGTLDKGRQAKLLRDERRMVVKRAWVAVYPLDELMTAESLPAPDFVKIDVEEYEFPVLLGMRSTLQRIKPALVVELHGASPAAFSANVEQVVDLLLAYDYRITEITTGQRVVRDHLQSVRPGMTLYCL